MTVLELLERNSGNKTPRTVLCVECDMTDRAVRREIERLRQDGHFIANAQDGRGYALIAPDDLDGLREQYRQMRKRALCILRQTTPLRRQIQKLEKEKNNGKS